MARTTLKEGIVYMHTTHTYPDHFVVHLSNCKKTIVSTSLLYLACRFVPAKFNEIFTKYAKVKPNALNESELEAMRTANRKEGDFKGW